MLKNVDKGQFGGGGGRLLLSMTCLFCAFIVLPVVCLILVNLGLLGSMDDMMFLMKDLVKYDDVCCL